MIKAILHGSLVVADLEQSRKFYQDLLGLKLDKTRPDLGYPGLWFDVGEQQLHLLQLDNPDPVDGRPQHVGRDRHIAMAVDDIDELSARLQQAGINITRSRSGRVAMFCRDPDGNGLEFIQQA